MTIMHILAVVIGWDCLKTVFRELIKMWVELDEELEEDPEEDDGDI